jgi:hypothetical protein
MRTRSPPIEEIVAELVENGPRTITHRELRSLGEAGDTLLRWGALREGETLTSVSCDSCGEDHIVELDFDPATSLWQYYCGSAGFVAVAEDDLATFRFDLGWLADRLAEGLLIRRPRRRELVPDVLWDLGDAELGGRAWSAFIARAVAAHLDPILDALRTRGGKLTGIVLTGLPTIPSTVPLPHGHRFVLLGDALDATTGHPEIAKHAVLAELRWGRSSKAQRPKGRPSRSALVRELFERRRLAGETAGALAKEARAIHELILREGPGQDDPKIGTIQNIIRNSYWECVGKTARPMK